MAQLASQQSAIKQLKVRTAQQEVVLAVQQQKAQQLKSQRRIAAFKVLRVGWDKKDCAHACTKQQTAQAQGEYDLSSWNEALPRGACARPPTKIEAIQTLHLLTLLLIGANTLQYSTDSEVQQLKCGLDLCINLLLNTLQRNSTAIDVMRIEAAIATCQGFITHNIPKNTFAYSLPTLECTLWKRICVAFELFKAAYKEAGCRVALSSARESVFSPAAVSKARYRRALGHAAKALEDTIYEAPATLSRNSRNR